MHGQSHRHLGYTQPFLTHWLSSFLVVGFSIKVAAAVSRTKKTAEGVSRYGTMSSNGRNNIPAPTPFLTAAHLCSPHRFKLVGLFVLLFFTNSWPLHCRADMLAGALGLPPGLGLGQGIYCQPAGCDQKFMAPSAKARPAAAHQLSESHQGCKGFLGSWAAAAREGDWPCQSQGLLCLLLTRAAVPPPNMYGCGE